MNAGDQYVLRVIAKYRVEKGEGSAAHQAGSALLPIIKSWAGAHLLETTYSGSYAKCTAIRGATDVDLFISLSPDTPGTLKDIYNSLLSFLRSKSMSPEAQNVSIRIPHRNLSVDLVPGRKQPGPTTDHSLYRRQADTWTKTNVDSHIAVVGDSGRLDEIRGLKIWRTLRGLDFPSFYLELTLIQGLSGRPTGQPAANILAGLRYIGEHLTTARVVDPANTNNVVSDDLTASEKALVAQHARASAGMTNWSQIIW
jgi:hypothetical protein